MSESREARIVRLERMLADPDEAGGVLDVPEGQDVPAAFSAYMAAHGNAPGVVLYHGRDDGQREDFDLPAHSGAQVVLLPHNGR